MFSLDQNLIVARNNSISVMRLTEDDIETLLEVPIYEQIVGILRVPTEAFFEKDQQPSGRQSGSKGHRLKKNASIEDKDLPQDSKLPSDMIFVLTSNFKCVLYRYSPESGISIASEGNIADTLSQPKEPPFSMFIGTSGKCICMMLYDNILKVIPLSGKDHRSVKLQNSFNIRLKHTEAHQITPMFGDLTQSDSTVGVFYYQ